MNFRIMNRNIVCALASFAFAAVLMSCGNEIEHEAATHFETQSFNDFLWKKQGPVAIEAVIDTDFEECGDLSEPLVLQLCNDDGEAITPDVASLYVDGELSEDNTIVLEPDDDTEETELRIVLDKSQLGETRTFTWNLQVVDNPGLLKINESDPDSTPWIAGTTVHWNNRHVANSLKVGVDTALLVILGAFLVVLLLCRARIRRFRFSLIEIADTVNRNDVISIHSPRKYAKIVLTANPKKKQNPLAAMFVGKTKYMFVCGDKWTSDVILLPEGRSVNDASVNAFSPDPGYSFTRKGESEILMTHPDKSKSRITW